MNDPTEYKYGLIPIVLAILARTVFDLWQRLRK